MLKKTDYWFVRIAFLCVQLLETKSTDRSQTLLHYIANMVRDKYPAVSPFYNELHYVDKAAAGESLSRESECLLLIPGQSLDLSSKDSVETWTQSLDPWNKFCQKKRQYKKQHKVYLGIFTVPALNRIVFSLVRSESGECSLWCERATAWHGTHLERVQCPTQQHTQRFYQQEWITTQQAAGRCMHR